MNLSMTRLFGILKVKPSFEEASLPKSEVLRPSLRRSRNKNTRMTCDKCCCSEVSFLSASSSLVQSLMEESGNMPFDPAYSPASNKVQVIRVVSCSCITLLAESIVDLPLKQDSILKPNFSEEGCNEI